MPLGKALIAIAAMAIVTFGTRAAPFLFFRSRLPPRALTLVLGSIPPAIMMILVLASFKDIAWSKAPFGAPEIGCALLVAALHLWKRNAFLSIFGGTACYMILVRLIIT